MPGPAAELRDGLRRGVCRRSSWKCRAAETLPHSAETPSVGDLADVLCMGERGPAEQHIHARQD